MDGTPLDFAALQKLFAEGDLEKMFKAFFPKLELDNWQEVLEKKNFDANDLPYLLKVENITRYMQECHYCNNSYCRNNCPLPFTEKMTVLDMLHKIGVEDNVSFYEAKRNSGKSDLILNIIWQRDFNEQFIKQLSGMTTGKKITSDEAGNDDEGGIALKDCFEEFRKPEMLDDDNKWYCNKCQDHVRATKQMEIFKAPPILIVNLKRFK